MPCEISFDYKGKGAVIVYAGMHQKLTFRKAGRPLTLNIYDEQKKKDSLHFFGAHFIYFKFESEEGCQLDIKVTFANTNERVNLQRENLMRK